MKKIKMLLGLVAIVSICLAVAANSNTNRTEKIFNALGHTEALALSEGGGDVIKCYCMAWYQTGRNCAVDGADTESGPCAQSAPGGNINCNDYNGNCK